MSLSSVVSPEVEIALKRQRAKATISSLLISILAIVLLGIILALIAIKGLSFSTPDVVTYKASSPEDNQLEERKISPTVQRKPSSPSSSMAKVIAANVASPVAIPVPEVEVPVESVDFGNGDDFGAGWGSGGGGGGGGGTTFFGQKSSAERIAFVIDYSASMRQNDRVGIMKKELAKSLGKLAPGTDYQMIFFAGPVWVAGNEISDPRSKGESTITDDAGKKYRWETSGGAHAWKPKGLRQRAEWLKIPTGKGLIGNQRTEAIDEGQNNLKQSQKIVKETPLVWGTRWKYALEMALDMEPAPEVIYFMTDGSTGSEAESVAKSIGNKAKRSGTQVNCIAMMEPRAHEAMKDLCKRTGGKFTVVEKNGKRVDVPIK